MYKGTYVPTTQRCAGHRPAQVTLGSPTEPSLHLFAAGPGRHQLRAVGSGSTGGEDEEEPLAHRRAGREGAKELPPRARPCEAQAAPRRRCPTRGLG